MYVSGSYQTMGVTVVEFVLPGRIPPTELGAILNEYIAEVELHRSRRVVIAGRTPAWLISSIAAISRSMGVVPCVFDPRTKSSICADGVMINVTVFVGTPCPSVYMLAGPPKSGKTYAAAHINDSLVGTGIMFNVIEANVDMEGPWAAIIGRIPAWIKEVKRALIPRFSHYINEYVSATLNLLDNGYAVIASLGGLPSEENRYYITRVATYALSRGFPVNILILRPRVEKYESLLYEWVDLVDDICSRVSCHYLITDSRNAIDWVVSDVRSRCAR